MLTFLALVTAVLHAEPHFDDMVFTKGDAPAIRLRMTPDGRARITRGHHLIVDGRLAGEDSLFRIELPEGDVCPPVTIELIHEVEQRQGMGAEVTVDLSTVDAQARRACAALAPIAGSYARVQ